MRRSGSESRAHPGARVVALAAIGALAWLGCGGAQSQRLSDVDGELALVERDHASSDARWGMNVDDGDYRKSDDSLVGAPTASAKPAAKPVARPVVRLEEPAEVGAPESGDGATDEDDPNRPRLKLGPRGQIEETVPDEGTASTKPVKSGAIDPQATADYEQAQRLVAAKKWQAALDSFAGFLLRYPDHPYAPSAFYWRGECYYALADYGSAIAQFEGLLSRFPTAAKVPDALLKLGLSEKKLGSAAKAKAAFDRLRRDYPLSPAAKKIPPENAP